ncbi:DUF2321 domain-containing protein [Granulicella aggregans]|uniref:DUF2321 domain-containing protein n=1 Tax=Granulicella aggregans TaxID=474949 RepID=UPI0021DFDB8D|nr:DUF2321 domain-containing protein [Granulicella aggregans]
MVFLVIPNAIYCRNGHFNGFAPEQNTSLRYKGVFHEWQERELREKLVRLAFCPRCGVDNINGCLHCETIIDDDIEHRSERPSYCCACGKPFPWTEAALATAREYTDELEQLNAEDNAALKATFPDLTVETARTGLAASRFKKLIAKVAPAAGDVLRKILVDVATEAAKRAMGG